jgi:probable HAF family extracellular repeat protein
MNSSGQIVGWFNDASANLHAFLWEKGNFTELTKGGYAGRAEAMSISDSDRVAGYVSTPTNQTRAVVWTKNEIFDLGFPDGVSESVGAQAVAVNNGGDVAVLAGLWGYLWRNGRFTLLGDLRDSLVPRAINSSRVIVGFHLRSWPGGGAIRASVWSNGVLTELPTLGGVHSFANAINDKGEVAGSAMDPKGVMHAVIWIRD